MRGTALGFGLAAMATGAALAGPLDAYRDRARVLVLSAPEAGDADLRAQRAALGSARTGLADRDLALAILGSCRGEILSCGNPGDVVTVLRRAQVDLHDRCALMDQAFAVGSLPMAKIEKYRSRASVSAPE